MKAQDYGVTENIIFQDKKSTLMLENNGKSSSGNIMKHINIRYFFVTGRIQKGDLSLEWCLTNDTTGDFFTKPNQGSLFRRFRYMIMGVVVKP